MENVKSLNSLSYLKVITQTENVNIEFEDLVEEKVIWYFGKKISSLVYYAKTVLNKEDDKPVCPKCGHSMHKHGYTNPIKVKYTSDNASRPTFILLRKARYACDFCHRTMQMEASKLIDKFKSISLRAKHYILSLLTTEFSMTEIARQATTSVSYVLNVLVNSIDPYNLSKYDNLPKHICIDEVRVINRVCNFICCDAVKGTIIGVLPSNDGKSIIEFFQKFPLKVRQTVETITMDLNISYPNIMRRLFHHAALIADRFHLVKMLHSALDEKRIEVYKRYKKSNIEYKVLKFYYKIFHKFEDDLDSEHLKQWYRLGSTPYTELELLDIGLNCDEELRIIYDLVQEVRGALTEYNYLKMITILQEYTVRKSNLIIQRREWSIKNGKKNTYNSNDYYPKELQENPVDYKFSTFMRKSNYDLVINAFKEEYKGFTNGKIEGINNVVKHLKSNAYGFKLFDNFYRRVLLKINS